MSNEAYKETRRMRREELPIDEQPTAEQPLPAAEQQAQWTALLSSALPQPAATEPQPHHQPPYQPRVGVRPPRRRFRGGMLAGAAVFGMVGLLAGVLLARPWSHGPVDATSAGVAVATTAAGGAGTGQATAPRGSAPAPAANANANANANAGGEVQVVRQGFAQVPVAPGDDPKVAYAVILRNPRGDQVAGDVHAIITFTTSNGTLIAPEDKDLNALLPGQTGAVAGDVDGTGVTRMSVRVVVNHWAPAQGLAGRLSAAGVRTGRALDGEGLTTVATVHSTLRRDLTDVKAVAVYYNSAGRIIGGDDDKIDFLPAGGTAPVTIDASHVAPGVARTEVYANPDGLFVVPGSD
jgi:hypothetical protein